MSALQEGHTECTGCPFGLASNGTECGHWPVLAAILLGGLLVLAASCSCYIKLRLSRQRSQRSKILDMQQDGLQEKIATDKPSKTMAEPAASEQMAMISCKRGPYASSPRVDSASIFTTMAAQLLANVPANMKQRHITGAVVSQNPDVSTLERTGNGRSGVAEHVVAGIESASVRAQNFVAEPDILEEQSNSLCECPEGSPLGQQTNEKDIVDGTSLAVSASTRNADLLPKSGTERVTRKSPCNSMVGLPSEIDAPAPGKDIPTSADITARLACGEQKLSQPSENCLNSNASFPELSGQPRPILRGVASATGDSTSSLLQEANLPVKTRKIAKVVPLRPCKNKQLPRTGVAPLLPVASAEQPSARLETVCFEPMSGRRVHVKSALSQAVRAS
eukprot:TRINITY_DN42358_c0_g1_i1.p1 TRINITY_DN42358_c0_g1~~TRINITY_DN42358_c0_g1_i1.p1  ORF type:complete len:406 (-),score=48.86 TRINITY_DN42358_c0_g1_i1:123-1298(-)